MTETEIIDATYWAGFWSQLEHWAFFGVVLTLAVEFVALKLAEPHKTKIEAARELQTAQLVKDAARLTTEGDVARKETAEAKLQLEQLRKQMGPRTISPDALTADLEGVPTKKPEILYVRDVPDAFGLIMQMYAGLYKAGWVSDKPLLPIEPPPAGSHLSRVPLAMAAGGQPAGVSVVARAQPGTIGLAKPHPPLDKAPGEPVRN